MASDKNSFTKTPRASGHCRYSSKKQVLEPVMSHIVDAIKMIVRCSKDEDFTTRCFASFGVEDFNGFSQTLSTELRTIAGRQFGILCDLVQEKELNANNNNNVNMEEKICNFDEFLDERSFYQISTTSKGKTSPVYSLSASTNENVTQDCEMARQTHDSMFDLSDIDWDMSKADSKNYTAGQNETTINLTVKKGTTVPRPEPREFPNQAMPIASQSTSMYKQPRKDGDAMSTQTSSVKNSKCTGTQEYETHSSAHEPYHFSKSDTGNEDDDWSSDFSQDDFWANITGSQPPSKGCLHSSNNYLTNCTKTNESVSNSGCHVTDAYPTGDTPMPQNPHKNKTVSHNTGEDQCVPMAGNNNTSTTQHLSINNVMDDFDLLAEIF